VKNVSFSNCSSRRQFVLLAPDSGHVPETFRKVVIAPRKRDALLKEMQKLRGRIYLDDGAIEPSDLTPDGLHHLATDDVSWHLLVLDEAGRVMGCMRYLLCQSHTYFSQLGALHSAQAECDRWGPKLRTAVESEADRASRESVGFGEAGGWALTQELRGSLEALRMVLATYSLAQILGEALVISTATMRNGSALILRRIGGCPLAAGPVELPAYFDPRYRCEMQVLLFDSRSPNPKYKQWVDQLGDHLQSATVMVSRRSTSTCSPKPWMDQSTSTDLVRSSWA
jgi:hypothetical protein